MCGVAIVRRGSTDLGRAGEKSISRTILDSCGGVDVKDFSHLAVIGAGAFEPRSTPFYFVPGKLVEGGRRRMDLPSKFRWSCLTGLLDRGRAGHI